VCASFGSLKRTLINFLPAKWGGVEEKNSTRFLDGAIFQTQLPSTKFLQAHEDIFHRGSRVNPSTFWLKSGASRRDIWVQTQLEIGCRRCRLLPL